MNMQESHSEPSWRHTKLSLERPYKDDEGQPIQPLLDIAHDGQFIYEPRQDCDARLSDRFLRIFSDLSVNFFDIDPALRYASEGQSPADDADASSNKVSAIDYSAKQDGESQSKHMTPETLRKMRSEILPRLHVALGELSHARDLLTLVLSSSGSEPSAPVNISTLPGSQVSYMPNSNTSMGQSTLSTSTVTAPPPILSVRAFDAQLVTGGKDGALRSASGVLRAAAEEIERTSARSEEYWADALRIRRANWSLLPAPLPLGAALGKGADKTSKDFLVSFGLEQSPPLYMRNAIAHMAFDVSSSASAKIPLVFPHRDKKRLRISLSRKVLEGERVVSYSQVRTIPEDTLHGAIKAAQKEIVENEIFDELMNEAGSLPTASARVSERLIAIDAANDVELCFELIDEELFIASNARKTSSVDAGLCNLISVSLPLLLLRRHAFLKSARLGTTAQAGLVMRSNINNLRTQAPQILQPIVDLLQYHCFLSRIRVELEHSVERLREAGIEVHLRFDGVVDTGKRILQALLEGKEKIFGESVMNIDQSHTIRFTFASPSTLTSHLPQATISIVSIPQLVQLLSDEVERYVLSRICKIGIETCNAFCGAWFIDEVSPRAIGRWDGCVLAFCVVFAENATLDCHVYQLLGSQARRGPVSAEEPLKVPLSTPEPLKYTQREDKSVLFFPWIRQIIDSALINS